MLSSYKMTSDTCILCAITFFSQSFMYFFYFFTFISLHPFFILYFLLLDSSLLSFPILQFLQGFNGMYCLDFHYSIFRSKVM